MKNVTFHEFQVRESNRADHRLARAILKYRPDFLFLEMGSPKGNPEMALNRQSVNKKALHEVRAMQAGYLEASKQYGYAKSSILMWDNIMKLWGEGHNVLVFNTDGPNDLRHEWAVAVWRHMYPSALKNWLWWVPIYLRERYMARNIQWVLEKYPSKTKRVALVQFGGFHWRHVKFLLTNPSEEEVWNYYFKKFGKEVSPKTIEAQIKEQNKLFYRYWKKLGGLKIQ